jgi:hypothetical protein
MAELGGLDDSKSLRNHPLIVTAQAPGENRNTFEAFVRGFIGDLKPVGALEMTLAARAAGIAWRLNRAQGLETRILAKPDSIDRHTALTNALSSRYTRSALEMVARWEQGLERSLFKTLDALARTQRDRRSRKHREEIGTPAGCEEQSLPELPEKTARSVVFVGEVDGMATTV